jgi:hypothetical protein
MWSQDNRLLRGLLAKPADPTPLAAPAVWMGDRATAVLHRYWTNPFDFQISK